MTLLWSASCIFYSVATICALGMEIAALLSPGPVGLGDKLGQRGLLGASSAGRSQPYWACLWLLPQKGCLICSWRERAMELSMGWS